MRTPDEIAQEIFGHNLASLVLSYMAKEQINETDLAKRLGVSKNQVEKLLGVSENLDVRTLMRARKLCGLEVTFFIEVNHPTTKPKKETAGCNLENYFDLCA